MAQGNKLKKKVVVSKKPKPTSTGPQRKGKVTKAPKKQTLIKHAKLQKKLVAGMTASLEQAMAVKAGAVGKLTILKDAQNTGKKKEVKKRKY